MNPPFRRRASKILATTLASSMGLIMITATVGTQVVMASSPKTGHAHSAFSHKLKARGQAAAATTDNNPLVYGGGPVQNAPKVYIDFWGWASDPSGEQAYLTQFLTSLGGTPWLSTVNQYGGGSGAGLLAGTWNDNTNPIPNSPSDAAIQQEAVTAANHFSAGTSVNVQIVVATPTGKSTPGFVANGGNWCSYHGNVTADPNVTYTDLPYMTDAGTGCGEGSVNGANGTLDGVSIVEGHELAETITDPLSNGWREALPNASEIGDKCEWGNLANITAGGRTYAMQPLWSNLDTACVMAPSSNGGTISNAVSPCTPSGWTVQQDLQVGNLGWSDRTYTLTSIPTNLWGSQWIHPAMACKTATNNPEVTFSIGAASNVNVALDVRVSPKPSWLTGWTDTGTQIVDNESTPAHLEVFSKTFSAGSVALGPNAGSGSSYVQYLVIGSVAQAPTAPQAPTNVNATAGRAAVGLSWSAPQYNGGSAITSYTVTCAPSGTGCPASQSLTSSPA
ncbi:MAG TPA: hypothetical protein VG015_09645, partial [Candidatus Dormibacteraeota bacterium]|nr:hypothetical protein [Candidatus Dormibacteraeota bacterium]